MKVTVRLTIDIEQEVPDMIREEAELYLEEHCCRDDFFEAIGKEIASNTNVCHTCHKSTAVVLWEPVEMPYRKA